MENTNLKTMVTSLMWISIHFVASVAIVYKISGTRLGHLGALPTLLIVFILLGGISLLLRRVIKWWSHPFDPMLIDIFLNGVFYFFFEILFGFIFTLF